MKSGNKLITITFIFSTALAMVVPASANIVRDVDYSLMNDPGSIEVTPESLSATVGLDSTVDLDLDVANLGLGALDWSIVDPSDGPGQPDSLIGFNFTVSSASTPDPQGWQRIGELEGLLDEVYDDTGALTGIHFEWGGVDPSGGLLYLSLGALAADAVPMYDYDLSGMTGYGFRSDGRFFMELSNLQPNSDYEYWMVAYRGDADFDNRVEVSDGDDINAFEFNQTITEDQQNGGRFVINEAISDDTQDFNDLSYVARSSSGGTIRIEWEGDTDLSAVIGAFAIRPAVARCQLPEWLTADPQSGTIDAGDPSHGVTTTLNPTGFAPGEYQANLCFQSSDPVKPIVEVPVTMTAELPAAWSTITGTVTSPGYCGTDPYALVGASVDIAGNMGSYSVVTDENGFYEIYLSEDESPLTITASAVNHRSETINVAFSAGDVVQADIDLTLESGCATVEPEAISESVSLSGLRTVPLIIGNEAGTADLNWSIGEAEPSVVHLDLGNGGPVVIESGSSGELASAVPSLASGPTTVSGPLPYSRDGTIELVLDDGTADNQIGLVGGGQLIWLNRFTPDPAAYPFTLDEVQVLFDTASGVNVGEVIDIYVYQDPDGNPANGADFAGSATGQTIQVLDAFSSYAVNITLHGPGDVLIAVVNRDSTAADQLPASMDQTDSQGRSWIGFGGTLDDPPVLPPDTFDVIDSNGYPGNWMIRGYGSTGGCSSPTEVPWLSVSPDSGTVGAGDSGETMVTIDGSLLAEGLNEALLCLNSDDSQNLVIEIPVSVEGLNIPAGELAVDPVELGFGRVLSGRDATLSFAVSNQAPTGASALILDSLSLIDGVEFAISGGDCAVNTVLEPGESCLVEVTFAPHTEGALIDQAEVLADGQQVFVELNGMGAVAGGLGVLWFDPDEYDFGSVVPGESTSMELLLRNMVPSNINEAAIALDSLTLTGSSTYVVTGGSCEVGVTILEWMESCTIEVTFSPIAPGEALATVQAEGTMGESDTATLIGTGEFEPDPAVLLVDPSELDFGEVDLAESASSSFTISNVAAQGAHSLELSVLDLVADSEFTVTGGDCHVGIVLEPGESCFVEVTFTPSATDSYNGRVDVLAIDGQSATVMLSGEGVQDPAELAVSETLLAFGEVDLGDDSSLSVTISNAAEPGAASLMLTALDLSGDGEFAISGGDCAVDSELEPGESCAVGVTFSPENEGSYSGELEISGDGGQSATVTLSGEGMEGSGGLSVSETELTFGAVNPDNDSNLSVTISNATESGGASLTLTALDLSGDAEFAITGGDCAVGSELDPGESCTLEVSFSPGAAGSYSGQLDIVASDDDQSATVLLSGGGTLPFDPLPVPALGTPGLIIGGGLLALIGLLGLRRRSRNQQM